MLVSRRSLLRAAAAAPALSLPGVLRAQAQTTLRFIPIIDLMPIGLYKQPTAYRSSITGILDGTAVFWNVRPS
jgi:hypothetical protein